MNTIYKTDLEGWKLIRRGKVRDVYEYKYYDQDMLLMVQTDRISAFDVVFPTPIPYKGAVLTQLTKYWCNELARDKGNNKVYMHNHLITANISEYPDDLKKFSDQLVGRSMLVSKVDVFPIECIVRGYLLGTAWKQYQKDGTACGIKLPSGLKEGDKLPEPIFTPSTKEEDGHDINITFEQMCDIIGKEDGESLRTRSINTYQRACELVEGKIIIADTKFEFGKFRGHNIICDEILTPDSSRFLPFGNPHISLDKQYVRDYLESIGFNKRPPAPSLPDDVVTNTSDGYLEVYRIITGEDLFESIQDQVTVKGPNISTFPISPVILK